MSRGVEIDGEPAPRHRHQNKRSGWHWSTASALSAPRTSPMPWRCRAPMGRGEVMTGFSGTDLQNRGHDSVGHEDAVGRRGLLVRFCRNLSRASHGQVISPGYCLNVDGHSIAMNYTRSLSGFAAISTSLALFVSIQTPVQAQSLTRTVSTEAGQSRTVTNTPGKKTVTHTRADGRTYTRETSRGKDGRSTEIYGPAGRPLEREVERGQGTATVTVSGMEGKSATRTTEFKGNGRATTTVSGSGGRSATRTFDHRQYYRYR